MDRNCTSEDEEPLCVRASWRRRRRSVEVFDESDDAGTSEGGYVDEGMWLEFGERIIYGIWIRRLEGNERGG